MLPSVNHSTLGKWAEEEAVRYLKSQGVEILAQNYRTKTGEIDIIARENQTLLLIEVKSRKASQLSWIEYAVSPTKIKRILKTAEKYIEENTVSFQEMRVDVIWLIRSKKGVQLRHHKEFV
ncbi:YraN family protein [Thermospira aquatica]|uniref:UPF0102 protein KDW03_02790 n=1 Tax=Thermospira aquatica TaxID=2828656 RepID=A0AAX3BEI4_9SPIR|nr:YraN family protein [Thermospira aquatica]